MMTSLGKEIKQEGVKVIRFLESIAQKLATDLLTRKGDRGRGNRKGEIREIEWKYNWPGDANGVIEAVVAKYVEEFGQCAASADNAERGQQDVPANERSTKLVTRSVGHKLLSSKNDQHVDTDVVEAGRPVAVEPHFGVGVLKIIFELEDVWVVGHSHQIHPVDIAWRGICYV